MSIDFEVAEQEVKAARIADASARAFLERIQGTDLIRRGCVTVIALDAIRLRFGDRWDRRREQVWEHAHRCIDQRLSEGDLTTRVSETEFLICLARDSGVIAQVASTKILEEILSHFLGSCSPADLSVRTVTHVNGYELVSQALDTDELVRSARSESDSALGRVMAAAADRSTRLAVTVDTMSHRLGVSMAVCDWLSLSHGVRAALCLTQEVRDLGNASLFGRRACASLESAALAKIDEATAAFLIELFANVQSSAQWSVIAPVSIQSISLSQSRQAYLGILDKCATQCRSRLVLELQNIEPGTPRGRIAEAIAIAQHHCRAVFVRTGAARTAVENLRGMPLLGVVVDAAEFGGTEKEMTTGFREYASHFKPLCRAVAVTKLPSPKMMDAAKDAGITHATMANAELAC